MDNGKGNGNYYLRFKVWDMSYSLISGLGFRV